MGFMVALSGLIGASLIFSPIYFVQLGWVVVLQYSPLMSDLCRLLGDTFVKVGLQCESVRA